MIVLNPMNYRYIYHKPNNQHSVEKEQISHHKSHLNLHFWGNIFLPTRWCPAVISWFIDHSNEFNISIPHPSGIGAICPNLANINQQPMARGWVRGPVRDPSELDNTGVQQLFIAALFTGWPVCRQHGQGILSRAGQGGSGSNGAEESSHSWDRYERPQQPSPQQQGSPAGRVLKPTLGTTYESQLRLEQRLLCAAPVNRCLYKSHEIPMFVG